MLPRSSPHARHPHPGSKEWQYGRVLRRIVSVSFAFAMLLVCLSCGSSQPDSCQISGQYSNVETAMVSPGMCLANLSETGSVTIAGAGPDHTVRFPNLGAPCSAVSNGCSLSVQCNINVTDVAGDIVGMATLNANWTFGSTGFTGTTVVTDDADGSACMGTFTDVATRD
jgi:hypothetical protein